MQFRSNFRSEKEDAVAQETTAEFGYRLTQALEGHPHAPPTSFGRLTWLKRELEKVAGVNVSVNTVHKWVHGTSRPREDNIRALAKVLKVDEVWLSMGRKPVETESAPPVAATARGPALLVAGLIEVSGGRVTFPDPGAGETPHLWANIGDKQFGIIAVTPQSDDGEKVSFVIPEPIADHRVLGVVQAAASTPGICVSILDLTEVERQSFGGFSVVQLERRKGGRYKAQGHRKLLETLSRIEEVTP